MTTSESVAAEYMRFVAAERRARRLTKFAASTKEGQVFERVFVSSEQVTELLRVAARRSVGLYHATAKQTEVVWVEGGSELAVGFANLSIKLTSGFIRFLIPVRCDQTGSVEVGVLFAVGSPSAPAGIYAATSRRPEGPELIVDAWGNALVAFAWQCLLELVAGICGAAGKDHRGNLLVPVELSATSRGLEIVPMSRFRFAGSTALKPGTP